MTADAFPRIRLALTGVVTLSYWALLAWQYFHDGVPRHHLLARADLPSFSNWWGAVTVPALVWFLTGRVQLRLAAARSAGAADDILRSAGITSAGAALYAVALAGAFLLGREEVSSVLFQAIPLLGLLLPIYRAEYVLGFVLGLTYAFGPVLPVIIASVLALVSLALHLTVRRALRWVVARARR